MRLKTVALPAFALSLAALFSPSFARAAALQGPPPPPPGAYGQEGGWDAPPPEFRDVQRQGFRDGVGAARHDFDSHRSPDPNRHGNYRHPSVARSLREDYREGFRQGYDRAIRHMMGDRDHHHDHDHGPY